MGQLETILQRTFGYTRLREGQRPVMEQLMAGRDVLSVMPTGAGKSLCYQLPALAMPGITLVVSPLISLMKDQVESLIHCGVAAAYLNSSLTERQYALALRYAGEGRYKLIYVAPERLDTPGFLRFAATAPISMVAVDEAHCVSQWGQDFRPSYLKIPEFLQKLPRRPVVGAFTATATPEVRRDIARGLGLRDPFEIVSGFDRKNLFFAVEEPKDKRTALLKFLRQHKGESGIVYCNTRRTVDEVAELLCRDGWPAARYHAGLEPEERRRNQEAFVYGNCTIMVATNAFGMGIDKPDVRFVVHYNMPKDMESYYQEAGRAGRDGEDAVCLLLYGGKDVVTSRFLIELREENEEVSDEVYEARVRRDLERLRQMTFYCHTQECLRATILRYFGEKAPGNCGKCGNCVGSDMEDVTAEARVLLQTVDQSGQRFGMGRIIEIAAGGDTGAVAAWGLDRLAAYGRLASVPRDQLRAILRLLVAQDCLTQTEGQYPILELGPKAGEVLQGRQKLYLRRKRPPKGQKAEPVQEERTADEALLERLKAVRSRLARMRGVPAYVIFSDKTLREMSALKPTAVEQLRQVGGVGEYKQAQYGRDFVACVRNYLQEKE